MNSFGLKLISGLFFIFCLLNNTGNAQVIEEFNRHEFPFKMEDIIIKFREHKVKSFNIKCIDYFKDDVKYKDRKWQRFNFTCTFFQDSIIEVKGKESGYQYVIRNKEFYEYDRYDSKKEVDPNVIIVPMPKNNVYVKHFDTLGFQCQNVYVIFKSDTLQETQQVTKRDSLNRIIFENYQNFGSYRHGIKFPDKYEKTYYSGDTTIYEYYKKANSSWEPDHRFYTVYRTFDVKNKQLLEHVVDCFDKFIYFNNPNKNHEYSYREIIRYEFDNNGLEKRIIQAKQGLYLEGNDPLYNNESIVLTFTILK
jgi:hypothetical protein